MKLSGKFNQWETPLSHIGAGFTHLFFPRLCEGCAQPLISPEEVLCLSCFVSIPKTAYHDIADNETALRFAGRVPFQQATSFAYFTNEGLLQQLLHLLKYKNRKEIGQYLGKQFGYELLDSAWIKDIDMIVPVPLHVKKQAKRGFNQAAIIAEGMSAVLDIPCENTGRACKQYVRCFCYY
jgi:predicted amidophosphoribosyltransferase